MIGGLLALATGVKVLLFPAYHSSDFEVHRNWMAITHDLPFSKWYREDTSEWTLDYPPFFAWFEKLLSLGAAYVDPPMLEVGNLNYETPAVVTYQRSTVVVSELLLLWIVWLSTKGCKTSTRHLAFGLVALHPGLLIVDHIHFQYNGILLGLFIGSIAGISSGRSLLGAFLFAILLNFKHIFLYAAPIYFVFLLRSYCRGPKAVVHFIQLGAIVAAIFALSFGPVFATGQQQALLGRLFPFGRGLVHAYWAPNAWALYAGVDKLLSLLLRLTKLSVAPSTASMTGGLVGVAEFQVLPQIGSGITFVLSLLSMTPCLVQTWRKPDPRKFPAAVLYCTLVSFFFGYHVHEKAILMVTVPAAVFALRSGNPQEVGTLYFLTVLSTYSLFPLLFRPQEYAIKVVALGLFAIVAKSLLQRQVGAQNLLTRFQSAWLWGLVGVEVASSWILPRTWLGRRLPFLQLALISCYCAMGTGYVLCQLVRPYVGYRCDETTAREKQKRP